MLHIVMMSLIIGTLVINPHVVVASHAPGHAVHAHEASAQGLPIYPEKADASVMVQPHQAVVEVHGVVCSFCAYGIEKKLKVLTALDTSQFSRGIFTDIEAHRVTLALRPGIPLDLKELHEAILDAGYEPIRIHLRVAGTIENDGDGLLTDAETRQQYRLAGEHVEGLLKGFVDVQGYIEATAIPMLTEGEPIPLTVSRLEETS